MLVVDKHLGEVVHINWVLQNRGGNLTNCLDSISLQVQATKYNIHVTPLLCHSMCAYQDRSVSSVGLMGRKSQI